MKKLRANTSYFLGEGKANLKDCLKASFARALQAGVRTVAVFTANGEGIQFACDDLLSQDRYRHLRMVAVSFPVGSAPHDAIQISEQRIALMEKFQVPLLRAANPFGDNKAVCKTLEVFSGGCSLCVWAILVACDAGVIPWGEHVIGCCADTSILAKATPSSQFLNSFAIREIICKPLIHDISKKEALAEELNVESLTRRRKGITGSKSELSSKS